MLRFALAFVMLMIPSVALAQTYPDWTSTTVNDFGDVLSDLEEARLRSRLETLKSETGVEMVVVTLPSLSAYSGGESLETYATGLFNAWGVGKASTNTGVMLLHISQERLVRLELGSGYGMGWDGAAKRVIDDTIIPTIRSTSVAAGLDAGTTATINRIIAPHIAGEAPPQRGTNWWVALVALPILGIFAVKPIRRRMARCPQCQNRGTLQHDEEIVQAATSTQQGESRTTTWCASCSYRMVTPGIVPATGYDNHSSDGGGFGGGSSSGGGASGRY